jgi:hypothetical protein
LRRADHSSKESYRLCKIDLETEIWGQGPRKGCRAIGKKKTPWKGDHPCREAAT